MTVESSIFAYLKIAISILMILLIASVGLFFIEMSQMNEFRQYVNAQIERNGGLTSVALEKIEQRNNEVFRGHYEVTSDDLGVAKPFGATIEYEITNDYDFSFIAIPNRVFTMKAAALSRVR